MISAAQKTDLTEKRRAAVCFFAFLCLSGLAALFLFSGDFVFQCAAAVPAAFALLMLYAGIHALLAGSTPETTLVVAPLPLRPGQWADVVIRQAGPVAFASLRANLVCERSARPSGKSRQVTFPCQENFFDSGPVEVSVLETREFVTRLRVPEEAEPSLDSLTLRIAWRIEVWGKVRGRADFLRPFGVEVVAAESFP